MDLISRTEGQVYYKHKIGVISKVTITSAGLGPRTIRVDNHPLELTKDNILTALKLLLGDIVHPCHTVYNRLRATDVAAQNTCRKTVHAGPHKRRRWL